MYSSDSEWRRKIVRREVSRTCRVFIPHGQHRWIARSYWLWRTNTQPVCAPKSPIAPSTRSSARSASIVWQPHPSTVGPSIRPFAKRKSVRGVRGVCGVCGVCGACGAWTWIRAIWAATVVRVEWQLIVCAGGERRQRRPRPAASDATSFPSAAAPATATATARMCEGGAESGLQLQQDLTENSAELTSFLTEMAEWERSTTFRETRLTDAIDTSDDQVLAPSSPPQPSPLPLPSPYPPPPFPSSPLPSPSTLPRPMCAPHLEIIQHYAFQHTESFSEPREKQLEAIAIAFEYISSNMLDGTV